MKDFKEEIFPVDLNGNVEVKIFEGSTKELILLAFQKPDCIFIPIECQTETHSYGVVKNLYRFDFLHDGISHRHVCQGILSLTSVFQDYNNKQLFGTSKLCPFILNEVGKGLDWFHHKSIKNKLLQKEEEILYKIQNSTLDSELFRNS